MKVSEIIHCLTSPFERMFYASDFKITAHESIWAEDDEHLKQCMRYAKEFFEQRDAENPEPDKKLPDVKDPYYYWKRNFDKAIDRLDDDLKIPFKLFTQGHKYTEIAAMLHMDVELVEQRIRRARKKLQGISSESS